ncbi:hypothetical protein [Elizabethkingia anophelis]|uniref:hypothetical protein n=1 Tax=Elizabethkingia anophelis TaxID=1117645 RepID=UPI00132F8828|nr:hypothetical protein [Elizabethkingia anophelis]MBE9392241.1 hypothetical protein [Elizabethkingia anophelis]MBE9406821.1 hypothetical protein [Elizabethkingia anophelis]
MKSKYPQFKHKIEGASIIFTGDLQVKPEFPKYTVSIVYRNSSPPIIKIINPTLVENPPHVYSEKKLCLYHPKNFKWKKEKLIANEIIEWTSAWIYFYEVWLETGKWYGPEAPHDIQKQDYE